MKSHAVALLTLLAASAEACVYVKHSVHYTDDVVESPSVSFIADGTPEVGTWPFEKDGVTYWRGSPDNNGDYDIPAEGEELLPTGLIYPNGTTGTLRLFRRSYYYPGQLIDGPSAPNTTYINTCLIDAAHDCNAFFQCV